MKRQQPIRATAIKAGRLSMAHMRIAMTEEREDTAAMRTGRLMHMAILEPVKLAALPKWEGGRRAGKEWDAFAESLNGGDYLMPDEIDGLAALTQATRRPLRRLPEIQATEVQVDWKDGLYGKATARVDAITVGGGFIEVKSCRSINQRAFLAQSYSLGYHLQLGWYWHGLERAGCVYVLAIESASPYSAAIYEVTQSVLESGYQEAAKLAAAYRCCEACGQFPGPYDDQVLQYEYPAWAGGGAEVDVSNGTMEVSEL